MSRKRTGLAIGLAAALLLLIAAVAPLSHFAGDSSTQTPFFEGARAAEGAIQPITHPAIADPANISPHRAEEIYQAIRDQIRDNYAGSGDPLFLEYQTWRRFTRLPYRSPNHGERFVNHYVNRTGERYGEYEKAGSLPAGTIVIKDSFTVTGQGQLRTGPLFLMEKMPAGFASGAGTWRFMMLRPDGTIVGLTGGRNATAVRFCAECHARAGPDHDFLYFMPDEARLK